MRWGESIISVRLIPAAAACALLAGCHAAAPTPANQTTETPVAIPANAAASNAATPDGQSDLRGWLTGTWSFEASCTTDFIVHYNADGSLDNSGNIGGWKIEGDRITETVTQKPDENGEGPVVKVDPPEVIVYTVVRTDQDHGVLTFQGRNVPILRC
jgi:hypothetical protein